MQPPLDDTMAAVLGSVADVPQMLWAAVADAFM